MRVIRKEVMKELDRKEYCVLKCLEEDIEGKNAGIFLTTIPVGKKVAMHFHPRAKEILFFITSGKIRGIDNELDINPEEIVVLAPGEKHEIYGPSSLIALKIPSIEGDKVICQEGI